MWTTDYIEFLRKINNSSQVAWEGGLWAVLLACLFISEYQVLFIYIIINDMQLLDVPIIVI